MTVGDDSAPSSVMNIEDPRLNFDPYKYGEFWNMPDDPRDKSRPKVYRNLTEYHDMPGVPVVLELNREAINNSWKPIFKYAHTGSMEYEAFNGGQTHEYSSQQPPATRKMF